MIEISNVSKWYGSFQVLTDCTTNVEKGEVIVVCGPSGSGKSTLIKTVNALEPFQKGDIVVNKHQGQRSEDRSAEAPLARRHGVSEFRALPSLDDHPEPHARADQGARTQSGGGGDARSQAPRPGRSYRAEGQVPGTAFRRPAAAGRHRAGSVDGSDLHALRRADLGARSGNGQRGARRDGAARQGRHDDDGRDPRNGLCPQGRASRDIHGSGSHRRRCAQG